MDWPKVSLEELAGFLSDELRKKGVDTILVGGACVTIYSQNRYQSYDLDFVAFEDMKKVKKALAELGFNYEGGYFSHAQCKWIVEFVSSPVAVGKEIISDFEHVKVSTGIVKMLRVEDCIKDRLSSYFHWNDRQGLEQAIEVCLDAEVNYEEIKEWAIREGFESKCSEFLKRLSKVDQ